MNKNFLALLFFIKISYLNNILLPINTKEGLLFYYYITLFFGEEQTPQTFTLDTTSSIISSPCDICESCGVHSNEYFNISNQEKEVLKCSDLNCQSLSGKCENQQCSYKFDYNENAYIKGIYVNKEIRFKKNSTNSFNIPVGCTLNETNYIITQESDGIMGLNNDENSVINRLYKSKIISENIFSICLNHNNTGYLSLGEVFSDNHLSEEINYIPFTIDEEEKYYKIKIDSLEIGNNKIDVNSEAIIDTTASLSSFPTKLFNLILNEFGNKCPENACGKLEKKNFGLCAIFNNETIMVNSIKNWPDININFGNYIFNWKTQNYWVDFSSENYLRACLGLESTDEDIIILGTNFLHGNDVIFDRKEKKIGFVESKCKNELILNNSKTNIEFKINEKHEKVEKIREIVNSKIKKNIKKIIFIFFIIISVIISTTMFKYKYCMKTKKKYWYRKRRANIIRSKDREKNSLL